MSAPAGLPMAAGAGSVTVGRPVADIAPERYRELARRVRLLSWLSLGAMSIEGVVAIVAGIMAGSISLIGFGLDSAVEGFASVVIIWRFTGSRVMSEASERRAQRLVAVQFFVIAPYVAVESVRALAGGEHAEVSVLGMALAAWSLVTMPLLGIAKQRIAEQIGSAATKGEGRQNVLCAYLAGALLIGLAGNAIAGAWWLDPMVGLLIAAVAVKEGTDAWRGEGCCVGSPLEAFAADDGACHDDCCRPAG
jgi:divalent metal cation (Fe/Co/Zn/Cd) transporter